MAGVGKRGPDPRPIPEDFAALAPTMFEDDLRRHYAVGSVALRRWINDAGIKTLGSQPAPIPEGFAEAAKTCSRAKLGEMFGLGRKGVASLLERLGIEAATYTTPATPIPDDFTDVAQTLRVMELVDHYGVTKSVVTRWLKVSGISAAKHKPQPKPQPKRQVQPPPRGMRLQQHKTRPSFFPTRNYSPTEAAADVLRSRVPVYRCDAIGRYQQSGDWWRVGNAVVDSDELIARAENARRRA